MSLNIIIVSYLTFCFEKWLNNRYHQLRPYPVPISYYVSIVSRITSEKIQCIAWNKPGYFGSRVFPLSQQSFTATYRLVGHVTEEKPRENRNHEFIARGTRQNNVFLAVCGSYPPLTLASWFPAGNDPDTWDMICPRAWVIRETKIFKSVNV